MPIYNISTEGIKKVPQTNFQTNGILERNHLQRFLRDKIDIISEDTLIISIKNITVAKRKDTL